MTNEHRGGCGKCAEDLERASGGCSSPMIILRLALA